MKKLILLLLALNIIPQLFAQKLSPIAYNDGGQKLNGLFITGSGKKSPGVLILPAWKGIDDEARQAAVDLNKEGYTAFIADIYGEGNIPTDNASAAKASGKFKTDFKLYQKRISLALAQLVKAGADPERIAVIGYCFGGTGALEAVRGRLPVQGVVSIHGGLGKDSSRANEPLPVKILIENPAEDASVTPQMMSALIKEMNEGKADWQIITYAYSKHTFTDPKSKDYNEIMAKRAWQHTLLFLKEVLKKK